MRKCLTFIFTIVIFLGCCKPKYQKFDYNKSTNPWIDAFKDRAFIACLRESYQIDDTIFKLIQKRDAFNPYDGLDLEAIKTANKLGTNIAKNIPEPSMCEGCDEGVNYYMATCLHYYKSSELDSLAKMEYERYLKQ
ncbi:hypothetical protein [Flavobacterium litorale]|uniref:Lipoprotein n=1 Tax=Flavobacterium litorale TaxID=2856519 RepID=A0ABX8V3F4_9FLAO|nr:hypothetical protein [Flavobacterium litorale]QYJ67379.1 hypothetical protein K1I41_07315 [Flavobacterium litorale]